MSTERDIYWMKQAIHLAKQGLYTVRPNPAVGCVIVREGVCVGQGYHAKAGESHAEIYALEQAGSLAEGADVYVTLEPCAHTGRTGPCVHALIQAKVGRVIIASQDPHHHAKGGADRLRAAGIPVLIGVCHSDAYELNRGFFEAHLHGKPWVRCKLAISIDGRTALKSGESQWITGSESRASVQTLRALSGALITGIGTVLRDDPRLSIRGIPAAPSVRVILDRDFRMPMDAALLKEPGSVWWAGANTLGIEPAPELVQRCERIIRAPSDHLLAQTLSALYQAQIWDVCIEAGPTLAGAFFSAGWIDEIWCYMAPCWLGAEGAPMFHIPSPATMAEKISWHTHSVEKIGEDILWILRK